MASLAVAPDVARLGSQLGRSVLRDKAGWCGSDGLELGCVADKEYTYSPERRSCLLRVIAEDVLKALVDKEVEASALIYVQL